MQNNTNISLQKLDLNVLDGAIGGFVYQTGTVRSLTLSEIEKVHLELSGYSLVSNRWTDKWHRPIHDVDIACKLEKDGFKGTFIIKLI